MFLRKHVQTFGDVSFTLNQLLGECGYSTKTHNKSMYDDFRNIIYNEILQKGFASSEDDILTINPSELFTLKLSEKDIFRSSGNFVQINIREYETITYATTDRVNKSIVIGVLLFIKQFIFVESSETNMFVKVSYPSKQQIKEGIGISSLTTIEKAISILVDLGLIYVRSDMWMEDSKKRGTYIPTRNVYALNPDELKGDAVLNELGNLYNKKVYNKKDVENLGGTFVYLKKTQ